MAPNYSVSVYGIANLLANAVAVLNPIVTGQLARAVGRRGGRVNRNGPNGGAE